VERNRQMVIEGHTSEHDDRESEYRPLLLAAEAYMCTVLDPDEPLTAFEIWPWDFEDFKPTDDRRNLVKAGALIAAEIDRLDRKEQP